MIVELTEKELEIVKACARHKELKIKIEELEKQLKSVDDSIKEYLTEKDLEKTTLGIFKISWKSAKRSSFNKEKFIAENGEETYNKYVSVSESKRLLID